MAESRLDEILRLMDPAPGKRPWFGGASPIGCLRGVTPEQALWKPANHRHSIWEFVLHIAYWKYAVRRSLDDLPKGGFPRAPSNWPAVPPEPDDPSWKKDRALLKSEHESLAASARRLDPEQLDRRSQGSGEYRTIDLLHGIVMHDTYHVGQIQLLKRLHRESR